MTTNIVVQTAGRRAEVTVTDKIGEGDIVETKTVLEPHTGQHSFYITDTRSFAIREIPAADPAQGGLPLESADADHEGQEARAAEEEDLIDDEDEE